MADFLTSGRANSPRARLSLNAGPARRQIESSHFRSFSYLLAIDFYHRKNGFRVHKVPSNGLWNARQLRLERL
jgi:hypothetical protein